MFDCLRLVGRPLIAHRKPAWLPAHCARPAMHLPFDEVVASFAVERIGQRLDRARNQHSIVGIAEGERISAREQPPQHAITVGIVGPIFVVDATAPKASRTTHESAISDARRCTRHRSRWKCTE